MGSIENKINKYRLDPKGIKDEEDLQKICIECGSDDINFKSPEEGHYKICNNCKTQWFTEYCWSCSEHIDSRDPDNAKCPECGWFKCSKCGACRLEGWKTNPYNEDFTYYDENFTKDGYEKDAEMCEWCGVHPVSYRSVAYSLCESCKDQLLGY